MEQSETKLLYYLQMLNENWKRYDELELGTTGLSLGALRVAKREAEVKYMYAELRLAELGWRWEQLCYNQETKTYSFPKARPE